MAVEENQGLQQYNEKIENIPRSLKRKKWPKAHR